MALWKRFGNNKADKEVFHSSGIVAGEVAKTLGSTSKETFEQRKQIERNRRVVNKYRNAGVVHAYGHEARVHREHRKHHSASTNNYNVEAGAAHSRERRIDVVNPRVKARNDSKAEDSKRPQQRTRSPRIISDVSRPSAVATKPQITPKFHEPASRRYDPYQ